MPPNRVLIADAGASPLMATATRANDCPPASGLAAVLANSGYRRLFIAQTISRWGDIANTVALVMLVFQLTGPGLKGKRRGHRRDPADAAARPGRGHGS